MKSKGVIAVACLIAGIPIAAYGLTYGQWLLILVGLALVLVFIYLAYEWIAGASKPMGAETAIKPAANAAWSMKDEPVIKDSDKGDGPRT
ncbi:MAG: hypothetical protein MUC68_03550 [Burkholderiaceae bacterium]|jgi:hypothetical protein|nr:hypothetical protein [Burkholderiaceae bacterium]